MKTHQEKLSWEKWTRWGQLGNPSSHWTIGLANQWYLLALTLLTLFHFYSALVIPLSEDEIYYWNWSRRLELSYFDHPPMVSYLIRLSTGIFGHGPLGIRFFAILLSSAVLIIVGKLTVRKQVAGFLLFSPLFLIGAPLMTPDVPLLLFWSLYLWWMIHTHQVLSRWGGDPITRVYRADPVGIGPWMLGGMLLGLGFISKYTMALAVPCAFLSLVTRHELRAWIKGFVVHLIVASLFCSGILLFNIAHDFAPFQFQLHHAFSAAGGIGENFVRFVAPQILFMGLLPFLFFPSVLIQARDLARDPKLHCCLYFYVPLFVFFLFQSTRTYLEANWGLVCYIAFWPLAQTVLHYGIFRLSARRFLWFSFALPLLTSGAIGIHLIYPIKWVPPEQDRVAKLNSQFATLQRVAREIHQLMPTPVVFASSYPLVSYLRFHGVPAEQLFPYSRPSHFTLAPQDPCRYAEVLFFNNLDADPPEILRCFPNSAVLAKYDLSLRDRSFPTYELKRYWR